MLIKTTKFGAATSRCHVLLWARSVSRNLNTLMRVRLRSKRRNFDASVVVLAPTGPSSDAFAKQVRTQDVVLLNFKCRQGCSARSYSSSRTDLSLHVSGDGTPILHFSDRAPGVCHLPSVFVVLVQSVMASNIEQLYRLNLA